MTLLFDMGYTIEESGTCESYTPMARSITCSNLVIRFSSP